MPPIVAAVRELVEREVRPLAPALEHADAYPHEMVARMKSLGLFGALVPKDFGGLGVDVATYARVIEELCRGWMSLAGVINSHTMAALIVLQHGTDEQRARLLPRFACGEARGGLCLTEPHAGSDVQAIRTVARRQGDHYLLDGSKMFVTNGREGNTFALLALTDPKAEPRHRGMSCFIVEKGHPGLRVVKSIAKLGYKGVDTAELVFEEFVVPAANLVGGVEGRGFKHVMSSLETGRINIAARAVGVAQATWEDTLAHVRATGAPPDPRLADMAGRLHGARLLTYWAAAMKDRDERCDLEAGMAKLHASETAQTLAEEAMRVVGERAMLAASNIERYYRDTPLMIIGEGTNEIQRTIIARNLVDRYGERSGALASDGGPSEQRQMVLAVRQLVDKEIAPAASEHEQAGRSAAVALARLAELGVLAAPIPADEGGLALPPAVCAALIEELARGWASLAAIVASHFAGARALTMPGALGRRPAMLGDLGRGDMLAATALSGAVTVRRDGADVILTGETALVAGAVRAAIIVVAATAEDGHRALVAVPTLTRGVRVGAAASVLGLRGAEGAPVALDEARIGADSVLAATVLEDTLAFAHLTTAALGVGLAQASFEAALRYAQQRTAFGKPINQHQAIQLKLADMATAVTAARLLMMDAGVDPIRAALAKLQASATATFVTLESMRIHGGYGYTAEFPVERHYRDAARLLAIPIPEDEARATAAASLSRSPSVPAL